MRTGPYFTITEALNALVDGFIDERAISLQDLSGMLGIDPSMMSRWRSGRCNPNKTSLYRLEQVTKRKIVRVDGSWFIVPSGINENRFLKIIELGLRMREAQKASARDVSESEKFRLLMTQKDIECEYDIELARILRDFELFAYELPDKILTSKSPTGNGGSR